MPTLFFRDWTDVHGDKRHTRRWVFLTHDGYTVGTVQENPNTAAEGRYEWIINSDGRPMDRPTMTGAAHSVSKVKLDFTTAYRRWLEATGKDESWRPTQYPPLDAETRRRLRIAAE